MRRIATLLVLVGSIVASGSRGALAGAFAGLFVFAVLAPACMRRRTLAGAAVVALLALAALTMRIPKPSIPPCGAWIAIGSGSKRGFRLKSVWRRLSPSFRARSTF